MIYFANLNKFLTPCSKHLQYWLKKKIIFTRKLTFYFMKLTPVLFNICFIYKTHEKTWSIDVLVIVLAIKSLSKILTSGFRAKRSGFMFEF